MLYKPIFHYLLDDRRHLVHVLSSTFRVGKIWIHISAGTRLFFSVGAIKTIISTIASIVVVFNLSESMLKNVKSLLESNWFWAENDLWAMNGNNRMIISIILHLCYNILFWQSMHTIDLFCLRIVVSNTYCAVFLFCFRRHVSHVASFSGLSFCDFPIGIIWCLCIKTKKKKGTIE